jgi:V8-like Glu-specific endopeptidase
MMGFDDSMRVWDADEGIDRALVGPTDNRVHEANTSRYPFNTVCHLGRDFGDGRWRGCSAALVGPQRVLTAAHCLFSLSLRRPPQRVRAAPGRADRDRMPYGTRLAIAAYVPQRFLHPANVAERRANDYGVVLLGRPFQQPKRFIQPDALSDSRLRRLVNSGRVTVAGYPADRPVGTQWHHSERLRRFSPLRLFYSVDTCGGHSGSPIWAMQGGQFMVIGVHTSGILDRQGRSHGCAKGTVLAPPGTLNSGVRVRRDVIADLRDPEHRVGGRLGMVRVI